MKFKTFCKKTKERSEKLFGSEETAYEFSEARMKEYFDAGYTTPKMATDYLLSVFEECRREGEWEAQVS